MTRITNLISLSFKHLSVLYFFDERQDTADFPFQISHVCPVYLLQRVTSSSVNQAAKVMPEPDACLACSRPLVVC